MTVLTITSADNMYALGARLAGSLQAGDVVVLHGPLGAGKTTLVRGLGEALGVDGMIQSPTFVVARVHKRHDASQPPLVHVDAYRLNHHDELVDLDIDVEHSITLIEWGRPYVEHIATEWLDIDIQRPSDEAEIINLEEADQGTRVVTLSAHTAGGGTHHRFDGLLEVLSASDH
jgi:tRNA threonylcarbamoyladenosine biosynthesis protein TsaE